ncbi:MAG: ATP-dependent RNA helicase HrpA, partial [Bifidobacteriaceae bacterium]|nr:ATP-dependent RNA helicase HrpA [Bifidobacteriaceae bacterium]
MRDKIAARLGARLPAITYPPELPVSARRRDIARAIEDHQVVIVNGETGSGKTTQIPKILLELGRGRAGQIGHTQPRRIAARTVAERIAQELGTELGDIVGYQVRFTDETSQGTLVKVMTDGILLAEIQHDPMLWAYDSLIIDEAHERSLNIDFILGYLTTLLPKRPDLKVVITSATIDSELFAQHFHDADGHPAPVIGVTGRTYPVEVRYRPTDELVAAGLAPEPLDQATAIVEAAQELTREGPGDILVFCSGEREIRDAADALEDEFGESTEILPLFARLTAAEQHRVFEHHARRRIVVATNIAETSLTVPGVRYVIDPGTARISRYSKATKVQRLPIEPISQASANQRSGRCGRVANGIAIRLYSEADFRARPEFTEPEILRTSLASVILQMIAVGVAKSPADIIAFPFVQKPDARNVRDGINLLTELGALRPTGGAGPAVTAPGADRPVSRPSAADAVQAFQRKAADAVAPLALANVADVVQAPSVGETDDGVQSPAAREDGGSAGDKRGVGGRRRRHGRQGRDEARPRGALTKIGRQLAQMPIDPRLGRMIVEAGRFGVVREVLVIAAALTIMDVRERPVEFRPQADQAHARFQDPRSDFITYLNLWQYLKRERKARTGSAFRRLVRSEYMNYLRIREWQDLVQQLRRIVKAVGIPAGKAPDPPRLGPVRAERHAAAGGGVEAATAQVVAARQDRQVKAKGKRHGQRGRTASAASRSQGDGPASSQERIPENAERWGWNSDQIHRALLPGLLSQLGQRQETEVGRHAQGRDAERGRPARRGNRNEYRGARGAKFAIFPGSPLSKHPPAWIMAAELVETSRLWARQVAQIKPEWAEEAGAHLAKRTYSNPRWSERAANAVVDEKVLLYGLPIVAGRTVPLNRSNPALARELFIRHALVDGEWHTHHAFFAHNRALLDEADELVTRTRSRDFAVDPEDLFDFYDERIPDSVTSARHFDAWWKKARQEDPDRLTLTPEGLGLAEAEEAREGFPDTWPAGEHRLPITYELAPGSSEDGVTVHIPVQIANQIRPDGFDWQVPGLRVQLIAALIKSLPKAERVELVPAPDTARAAVSRLGGPERWRDEWGRVVPLTEALGKVFLQMRGVNVRDDAWDWERVPEHLRVRFIVENQKGEPLAEGHDLLAVVGAATPGLDEAIASLVKASGLDRKAGGRGRKGAKPGPGGRAADDGAPVVPSWDRARDGVTEWDFGDIPSEIAAPLPAGGRVVGYPALVAGARADAAASGGGGGGKQGGGRRQGGQGGKGGGGAAADSSAGAGPDGIALRVLGSVAAQAASHPAGVRELLLKDLALPTGRVTSRLKPEAAMPLAAWGLGSTDRLILDCQGAAIDAAVAGKGGAPWTQATYGELRAWLRDAL